MSKQINNKPFHNSVIPTDWEMKELNSLGKISSGGTPDTTNATFWNGNINWCTPTDISKLNGSKYIGETVVKISCQGLKNSSATLLPKGSVIVCTRATIGKAAISVEEISTNQGFKNIVPDKKKVDVEFLFYSIINSEHHLVRLGNGSTFLEVPKSDFEKYRIPLPPLPEQKAIAYILSSIDTVIYKSDLLIVKKEVRKKWLIQNLLTGNKRLKGFSEKWIFVEIQKLFKPVDRYVEWNDNELFNLISIRRRNGGVFFREPLYGYQIGVKKLKVVFKNDFVISKRQVSHGAWAVIDQVYHAAKVSDEYDSLEILDQNHLFVDFWKWHCQLPVLTHYANVDSDGVHIEKSIFDYNSFKKRKVFIPSSIKEQTDIAQVLQIAEKEIQLLKAKSENLKELKRGMMQQLLTGKKRLDLSKFEDIENGHPEL